MAGDVMQGYQSLELVRLVGESGEVMRNDEENWKDVNMLCCSDIADDIEYLKNNSERMNKV